MFNILYILLLFQNASFSKKAMKLFHFLPIALIFWACNKIPSAETNCSPVFSLLKVRNEPGWSSGYKMCQSFQKGGHTVLIGYNRFSNRLQGWNLDENRAEFETQLQIEGPDAIPEIVSFYYHNKDSIFILSFFSLSLIRSDGATVWRRVINNDKSEINGNHTAASKLWCDPNNSSPIFYSRRENAVYAAFKPLKVFENGRKKQPLCGKLGLADFKLEPLPIYLPETYVKGYYPNYDQANIRFGEDQIVYGFNHNPIVYRYNVKTKKTELINCPSKFVTQFAVPISETVQEGSPELMGYIGKYPLFFKFNWDGKYYYRVYVGEASGDPGNAQRKKYLMVFDNDLGLQSDFELPDGLAAMGSNVPVDDGVIFYKLFGESEEINEYIKVGLVCTK